MYLEKDQQDFLTYNYDVLHSKLHRTLEAANAAAHLLQDVQTDAFTDLSQAVWHGELYLQAVTLFNSAAKKGTTYQESANSLQQSAQIQLAHGPLAKTPEEARKRLDYFKPVFGGKDDASVRAFREFLNVVDFLSILETNAETQDQLEKLLSQLLAHLRYRSGDSGINILRIERDSLPRATQALVDFLLDYVEKKKQNPNELANVVKKYIQRWSTQAPGTSVQSAHAHLRQLKHERLPNDGLDLQTVQAILDVEYIGIQREIVQLSPKRS